MSQCPIPTQSHDRVLMAHGGGGSLMHKLIDERFLPKLGSQRITDQHDSAVFACDAKRIAFTTDSFVVQPIVFPGGDIGSLAVHGTVNDLAMAGAKPLFLSAAFILEEGFPLADLDRIVDSMSSAAAAANVQVVTGDTKVVDRGKGDGVYINTSGVGEILHQRIIGPSSVCDGDVVVVSGDIGRHGIAIMAQREGLEFESTITSDSASVAHCVERIIDDGVDVHCMRDLTRGGLASAVNEIALNGNWHIELEESAISVEPQVGSACEILGLDPLYVACEGRFIAIVAPQDADRTLELLSACGCAPQRIGTVKESGPPIVTVRTQLGTDRVIDMLTGEQLPRIC